MTRFVLLLLTLLLFTLALLGCASLSADELGADGAAAEGPHALVLGTAQDGGLPQLGCSRPCCEGARGDPERRRLVASLALVDPASGGRWLIDATPDLPEQLAALDAHAPRAGPASGRPPPFDAVFLTHAHMGHITGLLQLGREAYGAQGQPVRGSPAMVQFLRRPGPYGLAVSQGHLAPVELFPHTPLVLAREPDGTPRLTLTAIPVEHRGELSDTYAFRVQGPERSLVYLPDIDQWSGYPTSLEQLLASVDVALVDGSFFSLDELPDRSTRDVPHPPVTETLQRVADLPFGLRRRLVFTHLNHSNPAADPDSAAAARVRHAGAWVARDGQIIGL